MGIFSVSGAVAARRNAAVVLVMCDLIQVLEATGVVGARQRVAAVRTAGSGASDPSARLKPRSLSS